MCKCLRHSHTCERELSASKPWASQWSWQKRSHCITEREVVLGGKVVCVSATPEIDLERSSPGTGIVSLVHCTLTGTEAVLPRSLVLSRYPLRDKVGSYWESLLSLSRWVVGPDREQEAPLKYLSKQPLIPGMRLCSNCALFIGNQHHITFIKQDYFKL